MPDTPQPPVARVGGVLAGGLAAARAEPAHLRPVPVPLRPRDRVLHGLVVRVCLTAAPAVVLRQQPLLDPLVQPVKVDIRKYGRGDPALRRAAERGMPPPVLQVTRPEHVPDQPQEPAIVDLLRQDREHDLMVKRPEAVRYVTLDEPVRSLPDLGHLAQRGVAAPARPEALGAAGELRLVIRLKQQANRMRLSKLLVISG